MTDAYEAYTQLRVLKRPLTGVYLSFFLMVTLMILVSATWMGLYLAKRITRPVQALAAAAREIGAGHLDHRVERETRRRVRLARRCVQHDGRASWRPASASSSSRRSISSASTPRSRRGGATSRRSSSASRPASISLDADGRVTHGQQRGGAAARPRRRRRRAAGRATSSRARISSRSLALLDARRPEPPRTPPAQEIALVARAIASCTSRWPPRALHGEGGPRKAPSSCSTTSRRSSARRRSRRGARWRGGSRTRSRTR